MNRNKAAWHAIWCMLFALLVLMAPPVSAGINEWSSTGGPAGGSILSVAVDPATPATVYAVANSGVFKSVDGGAHWTSVNSGLPPIYLSTITIDPTTPATLYGGTNYNTTGASLYKSVDGGANWQPAGTGIVGAAVNSIVINPADSRVVFAGTDHGVFKSNNGGQSWSLVSPQMDVTSLALDPATPTTIYAGVWAGRDNGVFRSLDGGASWNQVNSGFDVTSVSALALDPTNPAILYAGTFSGIYKSLDAGATWGKLPAPAANPLPYVFSFRFDHGSPMSVLIATNSGAYRSLDGGASWSDLGYPGSDCRAIAVDPTASGTIYLGDFNTGVSKTTDGGQHWLPANTGMIGSYVRSLIVDPADGSVYAGTLDSNLYRMTRGGSWSSSPISTANPSLDITALLLVPTDPVAFYAGSGDSDIFKRDDNGVSWTNRTAGGDYPQSVFTLAVDPVDPATMYAGGFFGIYKSTDRGSTWTAKPMLPYSTQINALVVDPKTPAKVYAATDNHLYRSSDRGESWTQSLVPSNGYVVALALDPVTPSTIYAGTDLGIYKSTDSGATWNALKTGVYARALAIDPGDPAKVYASTSAGVLASANGGADWSQLGSTLAWDVERLVVDPSSPNLIYAGTYDRGLQSLTVVPPPVSTATPPGGSYRAAQSVSLAASRAATIYYTIDGSDPVTSATRQTYSAPLAISASTTLKFYSRDDQVSEPAHTEAYVIDTLPPVVTISPSGGTYDNVLQVTLAASEPATIYYTTDGTDPTTSATRQSYLSAIALSQSATFRYYAVDRAGNAAEVRSAAYTIISPIPVTNFTFGGDAPFFLQSSVTHDGVDAYQSGAISNSNLSWMETVLTGPGMVRFWWKVSSEQCCDPLRLSIDGVAQTDIRGLIDWQMKVFVIPAGSHTVRWSYSTDGSLLVGANAGWVDQVVFAAGTFDITPPVTTASPVGGTFGGRPNVTLSCSDVTGSGCAATYYCAGSGCTPTTPYTAPIPLSSTTTLRFYSVDNATNTAAVQTEAYQIDATPPVTSASPAAGTYAGSRSVSLYCSDYNGCASTLYCLGSGCTPATTYNGPVTISSSTDLRFASTDRFGNVEPTKTAAYGITPDTVAPTTTISPSGGSHGPTTVVFSCNDGNGTGCASTWYCLGTGCTPDIQGNYADLASSTDVRFFSRDVVGNGEAVQTVHYAIDSDPPVTAASPPAGVYNSSQRVTLSCSDGTGSGCANTLYCLEKGCSPNQAYSGPITVTAATYLAFYSLDKAGNSENTRSVRYIVRSTTPATIHVPADQATIQGAIDAASDGDTVVVSAGTYLENINFKGKAITVRSASGADGTIIDGNHRGSTVTFNAGEDRLSVLDGFTVRNGVADYGGGGIDISGASPTVINNKVTGNSGSFGGGIYINGSALVQGNTVTHNSGTWGGGMSVSGYASAEVISNVISGNQADEGGGIDLWAAGTPTIKGNVITDNSAGTGGGIGMTNDADALIVQNVVVNNRADEGNEVHWLTPSGSRGPFLINNTIVNSVSTSGSVVFADGYDGNALLENNIIAAGSGVTPVHCGDLNDINPPRFSHNLVYTPSGSAYGGLCSDQSGLNGNMTAASSFYRVVGSNVYLLPNSPAIDAGDDAAPSLPATDFFGKVRIVDGDGDGAAHVDMGAWEFDPSGPLATVSGMPASATTSHSASLTIGGTGVASYRYAVDGAPFTVNDIPVDTPIHLPELAEGMHVVLVIGKDSAGIEQLSYYPAVASWAVDTSAPVVTALPVPGVYVSTRMVTLTASEPSSIFYTLDGSDPMTSPTRQSYAGPIAVSQTGTLSFYAIDTAGNAASVRAANYTILPPSDLSFTFGGNAPWFLQSTVTNGGTGAYQSGAVGNSQTTWMETTVTGPGAVRFSWKVSSESFDQLSFAIDGSTQNSISGAVDWRSQVYIVPEGTHALRWSYATDVSIVAGTNAGWVDQVNFTAGTGIDVTPPTTSATPTTGVVGAGLPVTLACSDSGSGCGGTFYCLGTGCTPAIPYVDPFTLANSTTVGFYSYDLAGNVEPVKTVWYNVDLTPPTTSPTPTGGTFIGSRQVALSCYDSSGACSATYYCLGTGCTPTTPYRSPVSISASGDISFYSTDRFGNRETASSQRYTITPDTTPPTTTPSLPAGFHQATDLSFSCSDGNGSGCAATYCCLGSGCTPTTALGQYQSIPLTSSTEVRFYSQDLDGNSEAIKSVSYLIDAAPPTTTAAPSAGVFYQSPQQVTLSCEDGSSGSGCSTTRYCLGRDCYPYTTYTGPITLSSSSYLSFYSGDRAGNSEPVKTVHYLVVSSTPSTINVPADRATIQGAIDAAVDGDTVLVAAGTYRENINFKGKNIAVRSAGGPESTIIDGNNDGSVVVFASEETVAVLDGFTIRNGSEFTGGGIAIAGASPTISHNKILTNRADFGGGIFVQYGAPLIQGNTISGNIGNRAGGGIFVYEASPRIMQNLFLNNASPGASLLIEWGANDISIINNTIVDDQSAVGSLIAFYGGDNTGMTMANNIVAGLAGMTPFYCSSGDIGGTFSHNLVYNPQGNSFGGTCSDHTGVNGTISANPLFVYGTFALSPHSPAIDAGADFSSMLPGVDLAGNTRVLNGNGGGSAVLDIGAYEYDPAATVVTPGDCSGEGFVSLSQAQNAIGMFLGLKAVQAPCVDLNSDGKVSVLELQKVISSFLGR